MIRSIPIEKMTREQLLEYAQTLVTLLIERNKVLEAIPGCPVYDDKRYVSYALDWIKQHTVPECPCCVMGKDAKHYIITYNIERKDE